MIKNFMKIFLFALPWLMVLGLMRLMMMGWELGNNHLLPNWGEFELALATFPNFREEIKTQLENIQQALDGFNSYKPITESGPAWWQVIVNTVSTTFQNTFNLLSNVFGLIGIIVSVPVRVVIWFFQFLFSFTPPEETEQNAAIWYHVLKDLVI